MTPHLHKISAIVKNLLEWYPKSARDLPWRRTHDPYGVHVSEIMLQQTQVKTVIPYWERWMRELPTVAAAANASSAQIHKLWEGLGYYTRVRNLQKAAQVIVEKHGGVFPQNYSDILALPGIGRYTAGAICSIAFNQSTPILDGNVTRVLARLFAIDGNPKEKKTHAQLWQLAEELVAQASTQTTPQLKSLPRFVPLREKNSCSFLNQALMELGAVICLPRSPLCLVCPIKSRCTAFREKRVEQLPNLGKREAATARHFIAFAVERQGRFLVRQRPDGVVNAHLWEFPNAECTDDNPDAKLVFRNIFATEPTDLKSLCTLKHSITRYRITLQAFVGSAPNLPAKLNGQWKTPGQMQSLAFTSAHKKILTRLAAAKNKRSVVK